MSKTKKSSSPKEVNKEKVAGEKTVVKKAAKKQAAKKSSAKKIAKKSAVRAKGKPATAAVSSTPRVIVSAGNFFMQEADGLFFCMEKIGTRDEEHAAFLTRDECVDHILSNHG